jgi:hypothetical protein
VHRIGNERQRRSPPADGSFDEQECAVGDESSDERAASESADVAMVMPSGPVPVAVMLALAPSMSVCVVVGRIVCVVMPSIVPRLVRVAMSLAVFMTGAVSVFATAGSDMAMVPSRGPAARVRRGLQLAGVGGSDGIPRHSGRTGSIVVAHAGNRSVAAGAGRAAGRGKGYQLRKTRSGPTPRSSIAAATARSISGSPQTKQTVSAGRAKARGR